MAHQEPCACRCEEDCPHVAWPTCVYRLRGDLTNDGCGECGSMTWHLDGKCLRCNPCNAQEPSK